MKASKHFDRWSLLVIWITVVLFLAALFNTGFTHDLLLEAGVFIVSVKLILMAYKSSVSNDSLLKRLDEIHSEVSKLNQVRDSNGTRQPGELSGTTDVPFANQRRPGKKP